MANTNSLSSNSVAMNTDAAPVLLPCKLEAAAPEAKRAAKRSRKEPAEAAAPVEVAAAPKASPKKRGKTPEVVCADDAATTVPATEEADVERPAAETGGALVVAKAVRTLLKSHTTVMHCGADALPALNSKVSEIIFEAIGRALANGRKTLKNCDF